MKAVQLLLGDERGVYIPRDFVEGFNVTKWGLDPDSWEVQTCADPDNLSDRAIVRRVKKALNVEGMRAKRRENYGDQIWLWGLGGCTVLFISVEH